MDGGEASPVRAIADGKIVFVRKTDATNKTSLQYRGVRTDDGCVVIRHDTEIGDGDNAKITYYSVYMHLQGVSPLLQVGKKVFRKDLLGTPGQIYGQYPQIHFEIICSESNIRKMIGRTPGPIGSNRARSDAIYGDIWFFVPRGVKLFAVEPHPFRHDDSEPAIGSIHPQASLVPAGTGSDLVIRMHYERDCTLTTYRQETDGSWSILGAMQAERNAEYDLYVRATRLAGRYTDGSLGGVQGVVAPSPSSVLEMISFGRCIATQHPPGARFSHWRKIRTPEGDGWVDLAGAGVRAYSDADFPDWDGWSFINDDPTPDSHCDSPTIKRWLDVEHSGHVTHASAMSALSVSNIQQRLSRAVCQFPTEWSREGLEERYSWLKSPHEALSTPLSEDDFATLMNHARDLAFWESIQDPDLPSANECWHFPPTAFIQQFRRCWWFSKSEFKQLLPTEVLRERTQTVIYYEDVAMSRPRQNMIDNHLVPLNKAIRKYRISSHQRLAAFFGNSLQETTWLASLHENNAAAWYYPWDGRGFLQLTHPANYFSYWDFTARARQIPASVRQSVLNHHSQANAHRPTAQQYNADGVNGASQNVIQWRDDVGDDHDISRDLISPSDSAGFYWLMMRMPEYADRPIRLVRRTVSATRPPNPHHPTNQPSVIKIYYHSDNFRDASAIVNLPAAVGHPEYPFNGYIARCRAFGQVLAVVSEVRFPGQQGQTHEFPEGCNPRRD